MVVENSKKFYSDLAKGANIFSDYLTIRAFRFTEMNLIPEFIICDAEHYQYLQDELKNFIGEEAASKMSKILTLSLMGEPIKIIVRHDFKGIDLFAKLSVVN